MSTQEQYATGDTVYAADRAGEMVPAVITGVDDVLHLYFVEPRDPDVPAFQRGWRAGWQLAVMQ